MISSDDAYNDGVWQVKRVSPAVLKGLHLEGRLDPLIVSTLSGFNN